MRHFGWGWLAINSLMLLGSAAVSETRPQYGGALHVTVHSTLASLDPADDAQPDSIVRRNITRLIFETLVTTDLAGRLHPGLAVSWQKYPGNRPDSERWEFRLRHDVKFHDGTPLTAEIVAASLALANPSWRVSAGADSVIIEIAVGDAKLAPELALARNAIVKRTPQGGLSGTGPFHIAEWHAGKKLSLAAGEDYWRGRPFLDAVDIDMGKSFRDQLVAFDLGRADLIEIAPEESRRNSMEGRTVASSAPVELVALLFNREAQNSDEQLLRQALALSIGRAAIRSVLLQGTGEAVGSILPNWMSGYGFVFSAEADLPRARRLRQQVQKAPTWALGYDASDPMNRLLAERVALNARDAGLELRPTAPSSADLRIVRIPLAGVDSWISLANVAEVCGLPKPKSNGGSIENLYAAERELLATQRLLPLFHLPALFGVATTLRGWMLQPDGMWDLDEVWLGNEKP
jgi:MarR-like DNA-binding transcriptional regulator SgrR of sgrS sRNA